jgi:hypothetical protein
MQLATLDLPPIHRCLEERITAHVPASQSGGLSGR